MLTKDPVCHYTHLPRGPWLLVKDTGERIRRQNEWPALKKSCRPCGDGSSVTQPGYHSTCVPPGSLAQNRAISSTGQRCPAHLAYPADRAAVVRPHQPTMNDALLYARPRAQERSVSPPGRDSVSGSGGSGAVSNHDPVHRVNRRPGRRIWAARRRTLARPSSAGPGAPSGNHAAPGHLRGQADHRPGGLRWTSARAVCRPVPGAAQHIARATRRSRLPASPTVHASSPTVVTASPTSWSPSPRWSRRG